MHIRAVLLPLSRTKCHIAATPSAHASAHETAGVAEHKAAFIFLVAHPFFFGNALDIFFQFEQGVFRGRYDVDNVAGWSEFDRSEYESALDQVLPGAFPLRCACVMDCADAVSLVQEVGHVVF